MQSFSNWVIWGRSRLMEEDERKQAWKTPWLVATVARTGPASLFACFPRCSFHLVTALPLIISSSFFSSHYLRIPCQVLHGPLLNVEEGDGITFSHTILNRKTTADLYWHEVNMQSQARKCQDKMWDELALEPDTVVCTSVGGRDASLESSRGHFSVWKTHMYADLQCTGNSRVRNVHTWETSGVCVGYTLTI